MTNPDDCPDTLPGLPTICQGCGGLKAEHSEEQAEACAETIAALYEVGPRAIPAHCDVPLHAGCSGPLVTRTEHHRHREYDPAYTLICLACGEGVVGTAEQVEQAERARVAWEEAKRDG
jgi:hypothetical protein